MTATVWLIVAGIAFTAAALFYAAIPAWSGIARSLLLVGLGCFVLAAFNAKRPRGK